MNRYLMVILSCLLLFQGCCTLFNNNYRQRVAFLSKNEKDVVSVYNNGDHICDLDLPAVYEVKAGHRLWRSKYTFMFYRDGEYIKECNLNAKVSWLYFINVPFVLLGGVGIVGLLADPLTMDLWRIDAPVYQLENATSGKNDIKE